jgi:hypothetical protein
MADPVTSYASRSIRRFPVGATLRLIAGLVLCMLAAGLSPAPTLASPPSLSWSSPMLIDHQLPYTSNRSLASVSCPSSSLCVAVDRDGNVVTSTDPGNSAAATWTVKNIDANNELTGVSCVSSALCVAVDYGGDVLTSTDPDRGAAATWRLKHVRGAAALESISCPSSSLCVAVGSGYYQRTKGLVLTSTDPRRGFQASWAITRFSREHRALTSVSCPSSSLCFAVDDGGIFTRDGVLTTTDPRRGAAATWTVNHPRSEYFEEFTSISCPSAALCVAVDEAGEVLTSTDPSAGSAASWTFSDELGGVDKDYGLTSVSCASSSLCAVVDSDGKLAYTTDPGMRAAAKWTVMGVDATRAMDAISCAVSLCVAVDSNGRVLSATNPKVGVNTPWTVKDVDGFNYLAGISCTASSLCVAVDHDGTLVSSNDPRDNSAWSVKNVDGTGFLNGISCVQSSLCVAVDRDGNVVTSTDPSAGAAASWTVKSVDAHALNDVWCVSQSLCVAVDSAGNVVTSTDPSAGAAASWTVENIDGAGDYSENDLTGVSCTSSSLCVAVDYSGDVLSSRDPGLGPGATWVANRTQRTFAALESLACASPSLCVAVGAVVQTIADPRAGADARSAVKVLPGTNEFNADSNELHGVWCASSAPCLAVENRGNVLRSTDPGAGARAAWTVKRVDDLHALQAISCVSSSLCVTVDDHGYAFVGRPDDRG